jgi:hypothetical protein
MKVKGKVKIHNPKNNGVNNAVAITEKSDERKRLHMHPRNTTSSVKGPWSEKGLRKEGKYNKEISKWIVVPKKSEEIFDRRNICESL